MSTPVLELRGVSKSYPGVKALSDVNITVGEHEIVGLIGENGAGKSTLLNILAGTQLPDSGDVLVRGEEVRLRSHAAANLHGIGLVFQEQSLIGNLSVAENMLLGNEGSAARGGWYSWKSLNDTARVDLQTLDLDVDPATITEQLSFAQRQMVELAKALSLERRLGISPLILLDEPTSVLEGPDIEKLFARMQIVRERGSCIFVSHRLDEVLRVSDRVYVMRDGEVVAELVNDNLHHDELYELMIGRPTGQGQLASSEPIEDVAERPLRLKVRDMRIGSSVRGVDLDVHAGQVLGIAGVIGSGREELCRGLFGLVRIDGGTVEVDERRVSFSSPVQATKAGMGYVPAERRSEGLALSLSIADNYFMGNPRAFRRGPFIDRKAWIASMQAWIKRLRIKVPSALEVMANLSGGNQQKVVLARILNSAELKVLILDHPTRGLDVGAKEDVYEVIGQVRKRGIAVVVISDTLEETIALSDTVIAMRDGVVSGRFTASADHRPTPAEVIRCMV
jgi:ribose transport system ATP-binding protein